VVANPRLRQHGAGVDHEIAQQFELGRCELTARLLRLVGVFVEFEVGASQGVRRCGALSWRARRRIARSRATTSSALNGLET
jgi:hypothetical protein